MPTKQIKLGEDDSYDEENFLEHDGDAENTVLIVKEQEVKFRVQARVQFEDGPGWFVVDRRGHRWALAQQDAHTFALDLHDRTPKEIMEED